MNIRTLRKRVTQIGAPVLAIGLGGIVLATLLLWQLGSLVPSASTAELTARSSSLSGQAILDNPINAPFKTLSYALLKIAPDSVSSIRLVSALFGGLTICLFFFVVRNWYSTRIALLAATLFATSTWFLQSSRLGTPDVLLFMLLALCAFGLWLQQTERKKLVLLATGVMVALSFYIPGLVWFVGITAVWQRKVIVETFRHTPWWFSMLVGLGIIILFAPLLRAITTDVSLVATVLGLPAQFPGLLTIAQRLVDIPLQVFVRGPEQPGLWVGHTPILNILETALFVFGVYNHWRHWRLTRVGSMISIFIVGCLLISFGGPVSLTLLLPFIYLVIAAGLAYLLKEWFTVFPRNPIARNFAFCMVTIAVLASGIYHLNRYFITWPRLEPTQTMFDKQLP